MSSLRQVSDRWSRERGPLWELRLCRNDAAATSEFLQEVSEQGWLPETLDDWGAEPITALTTVGRSLGKYVPSLFVPILAHSCGLALVGDEAVSLGAGLRALAACPYGQSPAMSGAIVCGSGASRSLGGQVGFLVNALDPRHLVLSAADAENMKGEASLVVELPLPHPRCRLSSPFDTIGLSGVEVRHADLDQVLLSDCRTIARGNAAEEAVALATQVSRFGMTAIVGGMLQRGADAAREFAGLRRQGGKPIAQHGEISAMLSRIDAAVAYIESALTGADRHERLPHWPLIRELAWDASDAIMQVFGGLGYMCPGLPESCWRNVRQAVSSFVD